MRTKHFNAIALALQYSKPYPPDGTRESHHPDDDVAWAVQEQWESDVEQIAIALATTNPHFDKARFLKASGLEA